MISFKEARDLIEAQAASFGTEEVVLENAVERILDLDIFAPRDFPPFNRSAMDGIAVRFEDLQNGVYQFKCVETVFAGNSTDENISLGECFKIMTGAAVPQSADVVIRFEDISEENGLIKVLTNKFKKHQNIAIQGQDLQKDKLAVKKGAVVNVATVGLLASMGKSHIEVQKLPTVNVITTGNEVVELNQAVSPTSIYNSNKYVLLSLLKQNQIIAKKCIHVADDFETLKKAVSDYLSTDILILTGGVSAGEADYIPQIMAELGVDKLFHKVAIKPGKPIWCGKSGKTMVFALPGNPFSCLVTFKLFVEFYLKASMGFVGQLQCLPLNFMRTKKSSLDEFFPVDLNNRTLNKIDINGSGDIRLGFKANALAQHPADQIVIEKGALVSFIDL